jgi:hypothetical protein
VAQVILEISLLREPSTNCVRFCRIVGSGIHVTVQLVNLEIRSGGLFYFVYFV